MSSRTSAEVVSGASAEIAVFLVRVAAALGGAAATIAFFWTAGAFDAETLPARGAAFAGDVTLAATAATAFFTLAATTATAFFAADAFAGSFFAATTVFAFVAVVFAVAVFAAGFAALATAGFAFAAGALAFPFTAVAVADFALVGLEDLEAEPDEGFFAVAIVVLLLHSFRMREPKMKDRNYRQALRLPK